MTETVFKVAAVVALFAGCAWAVNAVITPFIDAFEDIKRIREILESEEDQDERR